ncbi:cytochrome c oxidase subunit II [Aquisalibacillus elongatus]|uniref:Cytochrome c oxidase subunit 2 n=1 Tax=Aquisalibacillus elongatus TaxID=485577 RepID=A0A3N5BLR3_9BACI|nr:cytochrome c oxidase subunit II [Aquisalibacillus elongatus]RPF56120.1 cytochrome c oxidase subunit 2 [Aquisalibacillus elongatus]
MKGWMSKFKASFALVVLALVLSGCGDPFLSALQPKGEGAGMIYDLMILSIVIMLFVFAVVMVIYAFVIYKYRQKKDDPDYIPKQTEGNHALETLWTVIPIILLLILAVPTVQYTFALADTSPDVNEEGEEMDSIWINVTGAQYWWHFEYEDLEVSTSQELYIPTDRRVYLSMVSQDVIHSFWVPSIDGKMDVNPTGNTNEMTLLAQEEGVYFGKCAELCGPSHSLMDFKVVAVSPGEFEQWVQDMQSVTGEETPESQTAQEGQELFNNNCIGCHAIGSSPNKTGPNLTNFGDREELAGVFDYNKENIIKWIQTKGVGEEGDRMKPGNRMTDAQYDLTDEEAGKIAEYLMQLKPSDINPENARDTSYQDSDLSSLFPEEEESEEDSEGDEESSEESEDEGNEEEDQQEDEENNEE